jgi:hypothetical protein
MVKIDFEETPNPGRPAKEVWPASQGGVADRLSFGSVRPGLCATSSPHVILSVTMPYFGRNEDMHGFWPV